MTAYDVRISGWSADVCSSDLASAGGFSTGGALAPASPGPAHLRFLPYGRINRPRSREKSMSRITHGLSLVIGLLVGAAFMVSLSGSRSEERRVGQGGVCTGRFRWSQDLYNKQQYQYYG